MKFSFLRQIKSRGPRADGIKMDSDEEEDADKLLQEEIVFLVSGLYLILVGILGAGFNIRALTKAKRVSQFCYFVNHG